MFITTTETATGFFAITKHGELKTIYNFVAKGHESEKVVDCEDIAIGPGPEKDKSYIYLGDIGDNLASRKHILIYRFTEDELQEAGDTTIVGKRTELTYPDGAPRNAETLLIDPISKYLYIVSKREDSFELYGCSLKMMENEQVVLQSCGKMFLSGTLGKKPITAGDISIDGQKILLKSYTQVFLLGKNPR